MYLLILLCYFYFFVKSLSINFFIFLYPKHLLYIILLSSYPLFSFLLSPSPDLTLILSLPPSPPIPSSIYSSPPTTSLYVPCGCWWQEFPGLRYCVIPSPRAPPGRSEMRCQLLQNRCYFPFFLSFSFRTFGIYVYIFFFYFFLNYLISLNCLN